MWVMAVDYNVRLVPERNSNSRSLTVLFCSVLFCSVLFCSETWWYWRWMERVTEIQNCLTHWIFFRTFQYIQCRFNSVLSDVLIWRQRNGPVIKPWSWGRKGVYGWKDLWTRAQQYLRWATVDTIDMGLKEGDAARLSRYLLKKIN